MIIYIYCRDDSEGIRLFHWWAVRKFNYQAKVSFCHHCTTIYSVDCTYTKFYCTNMDNWTLLECKYWQFQIKYLRLTFIFICMMKFRSQSMQINFKNVRTISFARKKIHHGKTYLNKSLHIFWSVLKKEEVAEGNWKRDSCRLDTIPRGQCYAHTAHWRITSGRRIPKMKYMNECKLE